MATTGKKRFELWDLDAATLEDRDVDLAEFFRANDIGPDVANEIGALAVKDSRHFGGGAATLYALRRVE